MRGGKEGEKKGDTKYFTCIIWVTSIHRLWHALTFCLDEKKNKIIFLSSTMHLNHIEVNKLR